MESNGLDLGSTRANDAPGSLRAGKFPKTERLLQGRAIEWWTRMIFLASNSLVSFPGLASRGLLFNGKSKTDRLIDLGIEFCQRL